MQGFSVLEAIEQAIQTERLGCEFYTEMAKRFDFNSDLKSLFSLLASKEVAHEKTFLSLKDKVSNAEVSGWDEVQMYMRAIVESEFFLGKNKALPSMSGIKTIQDAVRFAISFEKETLLYFIGIKSAVSQPEIVEEIIEEEKSHIVWLGNFLKTLH